MTTQTQSPGPLAPVITPADIAAETVVTRKFTVAEYYRMGEAGIFHPEERVELIEGAIVVTAPIGTRHAGSVMRYIQVFSRLAGDRFTLQIQNPIHLEDSTEPQPDVLLLRLRADNYFDAHPGPADVLLVIEVSDTSLDYDRGVKAHIYGRRNIPETWVLNLPGDCIEGFTRPGPQGYAQHNIYRRGEQISPVSLPDLALSVDDLLPPPPASE